MAKKKRIKDQGVQKNQTSGAFGKPNYAEETSTFLDQEINVEESYSKVEDFFNKFKGLIFGVLGLLLIGIIATYVYMSWYSPKQEASAIESANKAEQYFELDSFSLALNGDDTNDGFLDVASNFGGTKTGNLANYYAGVSYLQLGEYQNAIDYLSKFKSSDMVISSMALGNIGDAYMQLGNADEGISYYEKAANNSDNYVTAPMYHFRAGLAKEQNGDLEGAKKHYQIIKEEYPTSTEAANVAKYLARVGA